MAAARGVPRTWFRGCVPITESPCRAASLSSSSRAGAGRSPLRDEATPPQGPRRLGHVRTRAPSRSAAQLSRELEAAPPHRFAACREILRDSTLELRARARNRLGVDRGQLALDPGDEARDGLVGQPPTSGLASLVSWRDPTADRIGRQALAPRLLEQIHLRVDIEVLHRAIVRRRQLRPRPALGRVRPHLEDGERPTKRRRRGAERSRERTQRQRLGRAEPPRADVTSVEMLDERTRERQRSLEAAQRRRRAERLAERHQPRRFEARQRRIGRRAATARATTRTRGEHRERKGRFGECGRGHLAPSHRPDRRGVARIARFFSRRAGQPRTGSGLGRPSQVEQGTVARVGHAGPRRRGKSRK